MTNTRSVTALALALAAVATPLALFCQTTLDATNAAITFRYVQTGMFNDAGSISYGTTFWVTNHTSNAFAIWLSAIEVKVGSNWTTRRLPLERLEFQPHGKLIPELYLQPHVASYVTLQLAGQPTNAIWRLKVDLKKVLTGGARTARQLWRYPSLMKLRYSTGNTNFPVNPFSTNLTYFKRVGYVLSQEISED